MKRLTGCPSSRSSEYPIQAGALPGSDAPSVRSGIGDCHAVPRHAPGARAPFTLPTSTEPERHRRLRTPGPWLRKVLALAARLGRTATMLAILLLIGAALVLTINAPDSGATGSVPATSYTD